MVQNVCVMFRCVQSKLNKCYLCLLTHWYCWYVFPRWLNIEFLPECAEILTLYNISIPVTPQEIPLVFNVKSLLLYIMRAFQNRNIKHIEKITFMNRINSTATHATGAYLAITHFLPKGRAFEESNPSWLVVKTTSQNKKIAINRVRINLIC